MRSANPLARGRGCRSAFRTSVSPLAASAKGRPRLCGVATIGGKPDRCGCHNHFSRSCDSPNGAGRNEALSPGSCDSRSGTARLPRGDCCTCRRRRLVVRRLHAQGPTSLLPCQPVETFACLAHPAVFWQHSGSREHGDCFLKVEARLVGSPEAHMKPPARNKQARELRCRCGSFDEYTCQARPKSCSASS